MAPRRAAELADIDDAADPGAERADSSSADGPHPLHRDAGPRRRPLVAADRLHMPSEPRLGDDHRGDQREHDREQEEQRQPEHRRG